MQCKTCRYTNRFSFVLRNNDFSRCFPLEGGSVATLMVHEGAESCPSPARVLPESCPSPARVLHESCPGTVGVLAESCPSPA